MKKAMSYLPFVFIFALILGALILIWGFPVIQEFIGISKTIEIGSTLRDIDTKVQSYYNLGEGSTKNVKFSLPSEVKYVCFYDPESTAKPDNELSLIDKSLPYLLKLKSKNNIFIFPRDIVNPSSYLIKHFKPIENPKCFRTYNTLKFTIENKGKYVEIR